MRTSAEQPRCSRLTDRLQGSSPGNRCSAWLPNVKPYCIYHDLNHWPQHMEIASAGELSQETFGMEIRAVRRLLGFSGYVRMPRIAEPQRLPMYFTR
ncbi:uncharacterized protein MYCFIDRAFT_169817 [Pseudocercospora fijiensis CIRAD86]|uniref:Uncharacterized protein n=1 Tax=Pseudocercospora fijiensis (strain CIRAD86) TaxID=383855 RepID=N1QAV4_PSEFD|nr:uncharacterized protein MYCFIDRAFT_169817 [Pseudocercospora fijiensis CIRAD86]EME88133.1 hypothetical protein MYCFIDRAFT_169817 [Pseudocercospora fijiensis CIRAD86]